MCLTHRHQQRKHQMLLGSKIQLFLFLMKIFCENRCVRFPFRPTSSKCLCYFWKIIPVLQHMDCEFGSEELLFWILSFVIRRWIIYIYLLLLPSSAPSLDSLPQRSMSNGVRVNLHGGAVCISNSCDAGLTSSSTDLQGDAGCSECPLYLHLPSVGIS